MCKGTLDSFTLSDHQGPRDDFGRKLAAFKWFFRKKNQLSLVVITPKVWKAWRIIKLGTGLKTTDALLKALKGDGHEVGNWAEKVLRQKVFTVAMREHEIELVKVSVRELGFPRGATRRDIYDRALESGLGLCPAEVGPQLRLQYTDQPNNELLRIAMKPVTFHFGASFLFDVRRYRDGRSWLDTIGSNPDIVWYADDECVFVRRTSFVALGCLFYWSTKFFRDWS